MTVSPPVERVTPVGPLRTARPGSFRQLLGATLSAVAALVILFLVLGGVVQLADNMAFLYTQPASDITGAGRLSLVQEAHTLGVAFFVGAVLVLVATPKRADPLRVDGSRTRAWGSVPGYRRRVRRQLHARALYKESRYLPSVIANAVLWAGMAVGYYLAFSDVWSDPEVTTENAAWVAVGSIAAGLLGALLMIPMGHQQLVRVDDEGRLFTDAGEAIDGEDHPSLVPVRSEQGGAPVGRGRLVTGVLVGLLVAVVVVVGVIGAVVLMGGEARSPSTVADLFPKAGVVCKDFDVLTDDRATKTIGCRAKGSKLITITTYGNRPSSDEWLADWCATNAGAPARLRRGYYVVGDDFIIDIKQLPHPGSVEVTPIKRTATRLAVAVDGTARPYDCGKGS